MRVHMASRPVKRESTVKKRPMMMKGNINRDVKK
jgi:hypothetical protein